MKVMIVEDDAATRAGLAEILELEGYDVVTAANGNAALALFADEHPDFVCLDVMMPGVNGYDVCREIRKCNDGVPIIFISAKSEEVDKVIGLELGADDFIVKPFGVKEVVARIRAVTRRCLQRLATIPDRPLTCGDLEIHISEMRARRGDEIIDLSYRDIKILQLLAINAGKVVTRLKLVQTCWGQQVLTESRSVDQHIAQLRKKVEINPKAPRIIQTVYGVGYRCDG